MLYCIATQLFKIGSLHKNADVVLSHYLCVCVWIQTISSFKYFKRMYIQPRIDVRVPCLRPSPMKLRVRADSKSSEVKRFCIFQYQKLATIRKLYASNIFLSDLSSMPSEWIQCDDDGEKTKKVNWVHASNNKNFSVYCTLHCRSLYDLTKTQSPMQHKNLIYF